MWMRERSAEAKTKTTQMVEFSEKDVTGLTRKLIQWEAHLETNEKVDCLNMETGI